MKIIKIILVFFGFVFMTACHFTEEITIRKNGSGIYNLKIDMSDMTKAIKEMNAQDSVEKPLQNIDSTIYFKDILTQKKDSLSKLSQGERETLEALKDVKLHIKVDEAKGLMLMDFTKAFSDLKDLDKIKDKIEKAHQLQENKIDTTGTIENHDIYYSYDGKHFLRKVVLRTLSESQQERFDAQLQSQQMFLAGSEFELVYHFPKKIKKVNLEHVQFSDDRKTLRIRVPMDSLSRNPALLNLKVDF